MNKLGILGAFLALLFYASPCDGAPIVWVQISPPMDRVKWSQVEDIEFLDDECAGDHALPRVCLYRHKSLCRIAYKGPRAKIPPKTQRELERMCTGFFPIYPQLDDVPLRRRFSDSNYLPNQAPPSVDPAWQYQSKNPAP